MACLNSPASRLKKSCRGVKSNFLSLAHRAIQFGLWPRTEEGRPAYVDTVMRTFVLVLSLVLAVNAGAVSRDANGGISCIRSAVA